MEKLNGQDEPKGKRQKLDLAPACSSINNSNNNNGSDLPLPGISAKDMEITMRVLTQVSALNKQKETGFEIFKSVPLRPLRKALSGCLELQQRLMYNGKSEADHYDQHKQDRSLRRQKMAERVQQKKYIAETQLRRGRVERLEQLKAEAKDEEHAKLRLMSVMVPDGHVQTVQSTLVLEPEAVQLPKLRSCYACKVRYRTLHPFYDQLCDTCAPFNYKKRHQTADLTGKIAIVTGSRVKIGYQVCLKLLRAGATVVATTRFPNAAAATYREEGDFMEWKDRLQIYGLDLRDVTGIELFVRFLKQRYGENGIDILINNACQTVRRPRGYYIPMVEKEEHLWREGDSSQKDLLLGCVEFERVRRQVVLEQKSDFKEIGQEHKQVLLHISSDEPSLQKAEAMADVQCVDMVAKASSSSVTTSANSPFEGSGISHSAAMSQMIILPEDVGVSESVLPPGVSDINGQQLDLRTSNSWLLKIEEVSTPEIMECMFINAIAPFILNSRLKPLMTTPPSERRPDRFIVNVSAMEGKFYRFKTPNHPHTNMAKAALNMMTRTSAEDLTKHRIYMNSVDTGWINDENPLEKASKIAKTNLFQTPIDEIDAAARILDPIFVAINLGEKIYGKFLKDYKETEW